MPQRGAVTIETLHGGDVLGWSWLFPPYRTMFDARALGVVRTIAFDGACLRAKCEQDHAARLRADEALRRGHGGAPAGDAAPAARRLWPGPRSLSAREAGPMVPVSYRVVRRRRETHDSWTLELEPVRRGARAARPGPVRDALRVRQGRGADLGQPRCRRSTRSARSAPSAPRCATSAAATWSACAARSAPRGRSRRPRAPTSSCWPAASGSRRCGPAIDHVLAHRERYGERRRALRRPLARGAALHRRARALARALRRRRSRSPSTRPTRAGAGGSASSPRSCRARTSTPTTRWR